MTLREIERPVLAQNLVKRDGSRATAFRVFCEGRYQSVDLDVCRACPSCVDVGPGGCSGVVRCASNSTPAGMEPSSQDSSSAPLEESVGSTLTTNVTCVGHDVDLGMLTALFVERNLSHLVVVDESWRVIGVVREGDLLRSSVSSIVDTNRAGLRSGEADLVAAFAAKVAKVTTAADLMSSPGAIPEDTSLRGALLQMARSHMRDAPIVTIGGRVFGVLHDVEGLRRLMSRR
jgi:CBS domain-containing protein